MKNTIIFILGILTLTVSAQSGSSEFKKVDIKPDYKVVNENEYSNYKNCSECIDTENWTSASNDSDREHKQNSSINSYDSPKRNKIFKNDGIVSEEATKVKRIIWGALSSVVTISLLALIGHAAQ